MEGICPEVSPQHPSKDVHDLPVVSYEAESLLNGLEDGLAPLVDDAIPELGVIGVALDGVVLEVDVVAWKGRAMISGFLLCP